MGGAGKSTCHYYHSGGNVSCDRCCASIGTLYPDLLPARFFRAIGKLSRSHENVTSAREEEHEEACMALNGVAEDVQ